MNADNFQQAWQKMLQHFPGILSKEQEQYFREHLRLQFAFPGRYVAYRERTEETGVVFDPIAASESIDEMQKVLAQHPEARITYVDDPDHPEPFLGKNEA